VQFDIVTLFPDFFTSPLQSGLLAKALERDIARVNLVNLRDFAHDKHRRVDDEPYGGGVGMLLKPEPIFEAIESLEILPPREIVLMTPQGEPLNQALLKTWASSYQQLILICGYPQYTRPPVFRGWQVPPVLRSGNHQDIADWRYQQQLDRTKERRPDLWQKWLEEGD